MYYKESDDKYSVNRASIVTAENWCPQKRTEKNESPASSVTTCINKCSPDWMTGVDAFAPALYLAKLSYK